jgi:transposase-like protein
MDKNECYIFLYTMLHPDGLFCPSCGKELPDNQKPHDKNGVVPDFRCRNCSSVFNIFSNNILKGIKYNCITIVLILRGFFQGVTTSHLSKELELDYGNLLELRHKIQEIAWENRVISPLEDKETESDEMFQNAGEKGKKHTDPFDPPRIRANKQVGRGTWDNDRPLVHGIVGKVAK